MPWSANSIQVERLIGELLELRPLHESDREALFAAASDPLIWEVHPQPTRYQRPVFDRYFDTILAFEGPLAVLERASGRVIGSSTFYEWREDSVIIGYTFLAREFWGGRGNGELKRLMLGFAFERVGRVFFHVGEGNVRSRRAVEKLGARLVEVVEKVVLGAPVRSVIYELTRAEHQRQLGLLRS